MKPKETGEAQSRATESGEREPFLSRWSRKKEEARQQPPAGQQPRAAGSDSPPPELPPIDKLTIDSSYRDFFHPKVSEDVRRAALKKLFSNPHFNVMDGLDVYIDDYSKTEPIPAAMMAGLKQAQDILKWAKEEDERRAREALHGPAAGKALEPPAPEPGVSETPYAAADSAKGPST